MIETAELLKKVRKLELITRKLVDDVVGGAYHSVFKGSGIEFDEVREYTTNDDIRYIDWNVSARLNAPYVKKYVEERELTVLLMLDVSGSMTFGAAGGKVADRAVEAAALLGLSAINNHDRVGLSLFCDRVIKFLIPRSGRHNNLRLIRELVSAAQEHFYGKTDIAQALRNACGILVKRSVIFIVTDLLDDSPELEKALKIASRRHDVIVLHVFDRRAFELPREIKNVYDAENGSFLRLFNRRSQQDFAAQALARVASKVEMCRRSGVEVITLSPEVNTVTALVGFFRRRMHRRMRRSS